MRIYLAGCGRGGQVVEDFTSAEKTTGGRWRSSLLLPPASKGAQMCNVSYWLEWVCTVLKMTLHKHDRPHTNRTY